MKYSLKIVYSPLKWLICVIFVTILPFVMYVPTYYDFVNISTLYLPFVGIVLFADLAIIDKENHIEEITYLSDKKPVITYIQRYVLSLAIMLIYIIIANIVFYILHQLNNVEITEPISNFQYIIITSGGCLFFSAMSMTISTILNNVYIGYGFSLIYWLFWNINCQTEAFMNPFPFIANPALYEKPLVIIYAFTLVLIILNCFLVSRSPFYLSDKMKKLLVK